MVNGVARMRWGDHLEFVAEAGPGDSIYVPPCVPHQEINASDEVRLHCVVARSGQQGHVVNLDITPRRDPGAHPLDRRFTQVNAREKRAMPTAAC